MSNIKFSGLKGQALAIEDKDIPSIKLSVIPIENRCNMLPSFIKVFSKEKNNTQNTICDICRNDTHNPNLFRIGNTFSITSSSNVEIR